MYRSNSIAICRCERKRDGLISAVVLRPASSQHVNQHCSSMFICLFSFQYDFVELLDGSRLISKDKRALSDFDVGHFYSAVGHEEESGGGTRRKRSVNVHEAGFIQYLDTGIWHLAFFNDGRNSEQVSYNTIVIGESLQ